MIGQRVSKLNAFLVGCLAFGSIASWAQKPIVSSVDKMSAGNQEIVTFKGSSFGTDPTKLAVFFGASKGIINFVSDQLLEVKVPTGASYDKISITHLPTGLTAYTTDNFLLSFGGEHGFSSSKLEGQKNFDAETGLYDLCSCDFDGDKKVDIATANDNSSSMTLLTNTASGPGLAAINYNKISILLNTRSLHATCGDLNGDGKPDMIVSEGGSTGDRVFIFQNASTGIGNFTFNSQSIKLTGKKVKRVKIADLDLDGKPELIVTNQSGNTVSILINQSTTAAISFASSPINIAIPGAASTDGLAIDDLNGDGFPEIVTSQFLTATSNLFILKNTSTLGNISMGTPSTLSIGGTIVNIKVGDLDNDQKPDVAVTQLLNASISVFLNQSTGGTLTFSAPNPISTDDRPWGIDFGDLDGDGKTDIAIASLTKKSLTILNNESTPGNLSFQTTIKTTTFINRHVNIGDVDGDAKPDIAFTSIDDNNNGIPASKISILRNTVCLKPEVTPVGPHTICVGFPLKLLTDISAGITYEWKNGATVVASGPNSFFDVTASGNYTVTAIAEGGACSLTSNIVNVTVNPGTTTGPANPTNNGPVCVGSTLTLAVNDVGGTQYNWTGPDGYTSTGTTPAAIPNFQSKNTGRYLLDVVVGSCIAQQVSTVVEAVAVPDFQVNIGGSGVVCPPATKTLSLSPNLSTFTYQWFEKTSGIIPGQTAATYNATSTGDYYVQAKYTSNPSCATVETPAVKITFATTPIVGFTAPATACLGQNITFTDQSSTDPSVAPIYLWDFGDGVTSAVASPVHKYLTASLFTVKLTVSYTNGACTASQSKGISIQPAPAVTITNPNNVFSFCPGDNLKLQVTGTFTSYLWSTTETTSSIFVNAGGTYSVDVKTAAGCTLNATKEVVALDAPTVNVVADPADIKEGETSQLTATGLDTYTWDAAQTLSSTSIANPIASPLVTTTYHVQGTDSKGCKGEGTVEVGVREGSIYQKLKPSKFFSPDNGDEIGKFWAIEKIEDFPQCQISIYDDKGIKVYEAKPYDNSNNRWDGTFNGRRLPDGVYYFVIKCEGEEKTPKTGSITLLR
jgi:gliding motility-associated-like protein